MKFIELRRMCNARLYALDIYTDCGEHTMVDIDVEEAGSRLALARYSNAEVVRFQPFINDDDAAALEVELNV